MTETCKGTLRNGGRCHMRMVDADGYCRHHLDQKPRPAPEPEPESVEASEAEAESVRQPESAANDKYALAAERRRKIREARKRLGGIQGQKLLAPKKQGFVRRWVNDEGNRLEEMLDKGYTFVEDADAVIPTSDTGSRKSQHVGTQKSGDGLRAYLMETPQEFYEEDQKEKAAQIEKTAQQTRRGHIAGDQGFRGKGQSVLYDPSKGNNQFFSE